MYYETAKLILANEAVLQTGKADLFYDAVDILIKYRHFKFRNLLRNDLSQDGNISVEEILCTVFKHLNQLTYTVNSQLLEYDKKGLGYKEITKLLHKAHEIEEIAEDYKTLSSAISNSSQMKKRYSGESYKMQYVNAVETLMKCSALYPHIFSSIRQELDEKNKELSLDIEQIEESKRLDAEKQTKFFSRLGHAKIDCDECCNILVEYKNLTNITKAADLEAAKLQNTVKVLKENVDKSRELINVSGAEADYRLEIPSIMSPFIRK